MMSSRGMGAMNPNKMPGPKRKERRDNTDFDEYSEGGETFSETGPREAVDDKGKPLMRAPDVSMMQEGVRLSPRYANLSKDSQAIGTRLSGSKKLGKDAYLEGYVDMDTTNDKYQGLKNKRSGAGFNFIKNFKDGGEVWDKPRPKGLGNSKALSPAKKSKAKAAAKAAGRPYPNLVDNMRAARSK